MSDPSKHIEPLPIPKQPKPYDKIDGADHYHGVPVGGTPSVLNPANRKRVLGDLGRSGQARGIDDWDLQGTD